MRYFISILLSLSVYINLSYCQDTNKNTEHTNIQLNTENALKHDVVVSMAKNEDDFWKNYFPSVLIAIVGILTIGVNYIMVNVQMKNQRRISTDQINNALLDIKNQKEIAEKQMKYEFVSNKRHLWINELRDTISEFNSNAVSLSNIDISKSPKEKYETYINKILFSKYKIELLLNPNKKPNHKEIIRVANGIFVNAVSIIELSVKKMDTNIEIKKMMNNIQILVNETNKLLKEAWAQIKSGE